MRGSRLVWAGQLGVELLPGHPRQRVTATDFCQPEKSGEGASTAHSFEEADRELTAQGKNKRRFAQTPPPVP